MMTKAAFEKVPENSPRKQWVHKDPQSSNECTQQGGWLVSKD